MDELERWLASINLSHLAPKLKEHNVTAEGLCLCEAVQELEQCGMTAINARLLMRRIEEVRGVGVQVTAIAPPQIPPPGPAAPPGNEAGLITYLYYIESYCYDVPLYVIWCRGGIGVKSWEGRV